MAKLNLGALAQDVRGSIGGNTFSRNRHGAYVRTKVSPVQPESPLQSAKRADFTVISQHWRNLDDSERAQWEVWATNHPFLDVFGNSQILSGNAAFMRVNGDLLNLSIAMTDTPLADPVTPPPAATAAAADAGDGTVTVTFATAPAVADVIGCWTTAGMSAGRQFVSANLKFAGRFTGDAQATDLDVTPTDYNPKLEFVTGQKIGVLVVRYSQAGALVDQTLFSVIATA